MYEVSKNCSHVSMSMPKVITSKSSVLGHTDEDDNLEPSRDVCRTCSKDTQISSEDKYASSKYCAKVSTLMSNCDQ